MTTRAVEQFDEWESSPFRDGYRGLHDLADEEFSGVVQAGAAKLCMLNGTVVGILDGDIDDYEGASGTAYAAPSPALPLLALIQERNDEVRGKYYSEDTPLSEVDGTLSDGNFTGFIELSENVLSGDYYVVYHRGRSMAVAWVGNSGQLLTEDEAFDRADGEVGIFQVRPAEIEPVEIPDAGADNGAGDAAGAAAGSTAATDTSVDDSGSDATDTTESPGAASGSDDATPETVKGTDGQADQSAADASSADGNSVDAKADDEHADPPSADATASETSGPEPDTSGTGASADSDAERSEQTGESPSPDGSTREERATDEATERESAGPTDRTRRDRRTDADRTDRSRQAKSRETRATTERAETRPTDTRTRDSEADAPRETAEQPTGTAGRPSEPAEQSTAGRAPDTGGAAAGSATKPDQLATHSIPSLDPSRTTSQGPDETTAAARAAPENSSGRDSPEPTASAERDVRSTAPSNERAGGDTGDRAESGSGRQNGRPAGNDGASNAGGGEPRQRRATEEPRTTDEQPVDAGAQRSGARARDLEAELAEREAEIEDLEADLATAESERDDLRAQLERVRTERDDLQSRIDAVESERDDLRSERDALQSEVGELEGEVERLESQVDEVEAEFGAAVGAEERLSPGEALDQTNLFVRYGSKGKATLETAHAGEASRQEVGENLGLEYHTQFDSENASVGGRSFDEFLRETMQYQFVTWVINDLLYEIRDTGKVSALQDLYDAIPRIDRAELNGTVSTEYTEDGQERRSQESFDVVMRDRMGNALLTANMNDSRQAASESMMSALVTASSHVGESTETLGASLLVTSSFFEPEALETAAEATSGGLLSRDKRESFVKLSRKQGYHLCLVEAREEKFHLAVPEL
ncbi:hypothetical protein BRC79_02750 [Halobacteriales archaeon QH_8_67_27]|nr:MAG: hypothetical protein BRC79_02750 [Halobacteriales archaeon QH_8_67_27]